MIYGWDSLSKEEQAKRIRGMGDFFDKWEAALKNPEVYADFFRKPKSFKNDKPESNKSSTPTK